MNFEFCHQVRCISLQIYRFSTEEITKFATDFSIMKKSAKFILTLLSVLLPWCIHAQTAERYDKVITEGGQRAIIEHLCDSIMEGRASGTLGGTIAGAYIEEYFNSLELKPFQYNSSQSFRDRNGVRMHNIMGVVPALGPCEDFIVVSAHYDHLGNIKGKVYPGADDNASGVAALLTLADAFSQMRRDSIGPGVNILFVAFDGKEYSMAGSRHFTSTLPISPSHIICEINMDILGSTLVPVHKNKPEYLIVLGRNTLPENLRGIISACNLKKGMGLDIDYTFYGSDDFTRTMYKLGDHYPFNQRGVPALLFTSGFHQHTLKTSDTPQIIDHKVLLKRTQLIFDVIKDMALRSRH